MAETGRGRGGSVPDPTVADRVIDAVLEELAESGLVRLSVDRVAKRAGVSKTTMYTRWRTKDDLILAAYQRIGGAFPAVDTGTLIGDLDALWERYLASATDRRYVVALAEFIAAAATQPQLREALHRYQESWRNGMRDMLLAGRDRGELADDVDVDLLVELVQAVSLWRPVIGDLPVDDTLRVLVRRLVFDCPPRRS